MNKNQASGAIRQIAYFVRDIISAASEHHSIFGSGPFYVAEHIVLARCEHRGCPAPLDHSSAYGQWGEIMVEFVQQNNAGPSVFHDIFPNGGGGLHHVALMVDDLDTALSSWNRRGMATALYAELETGQTYAMIDAVARYGHFIELYEPNEVVTYVYDLVRNAAGDFDGLNLIRHFNLA